MQSAFRMRRCVASLQSVRATPGAIFSKKRFFVFLPRLTIRKKGVKQMEKRVHSVKHIVMAILTVALVAAGLPLSFGGSVYARGGVNMAGEGTEDKPYIIMDGDDFGAIGSEGKYELDKCYKLGADIEVTTPACKTGEPPFTGTFDGDGHKITLNIKTEESYIPLGLFRSIKSGAMIKNLRLAGYVDYNDNESIKALGSIAGEADVGTKEEGDIVIKNCVNTAAITGYVYVGGFVGILDFTNDCNLEDAGRMILENCGNAGEITGKFDNFSDTAGLIGCVKSGNAELKKCYNIGRITGSNDVAGLAAYYDGTLRISDSYNSGMIAAGGTASNVGQIASSKGVDNKVTATNCYMVKDGAAAVPLGEYETFEGVSDTLEGQPLSAEVMKSPAFATALNGGSDGPFAYLEGVNNSFPFIKGTIKYIDSVDFDETTKALLKGDKLSLQKGEKATLAAVVSTDPEGVKTNGVKWTVEDTKVATIDDKGQVTALAAGDTTITATSEDDSRESVSCKLHVDSSITITGINIAKTASLNYGSTLVLKASVIPSNATNKKLTWKSSNTSVASVDQNGKVTGKKAGTSKVTVTASNGKSETCTVTVKPLDIRKASITVNAQTYTGKPIKPAIAVKLNGNTLKAGTDYTVQYSNNTNVGTATVKVTGIGNYTGKPSKTFRIDKASNPLTIKKVGDVKVKLSAIKKKSRTVALSKMVKTTKKGQGKITYSISGGDKNVSINKTSGKLTLKKRSKKKTYNLTLKVTAAGDKNYKPLTKSVKVKISIK